MRDNLIQMVRAGFPKDEILSTVTTNAAAMLGLEERLGSIQAGRDANLLFLSRRSALLLDESREGDGRGQAGPDQEADLLKMTITMNRTKIGLVLAALMTIGLSSALAQRSRPAAPAASAKKGREQGSAEGRERGPLAPHRERRCAPGGGARRAQLLDLGQERQDRVHRQCAGRPRGHRNDRREKVCAPIPASFLWRALES